MQFFCFPLLQAAFVEREKFFPFVKWPEAILNMQEKRALKAHMGLIRSSQVKF